MKHVVAKSTRQIFPVVRAPTQFWGCDEKFAFVVLIPFNVYTQST